MTPRPGSRGIGQTYPPASSTYPPGATGDRTDTDFYPPGRSTSKSPAQEHKFIDVTGDPGDRTLISTTRDVREEILYGPGAPYEGMCPHSGVCVFYAHEAEGPKQPPYHPEPPARRCIWCPDQRNQSGSGSDLSPDTTRTTPGEPERIGPLAAKYLDHLAAQTADPDLAARQAEALNRLRRPLTKEQQP